jgi:hypothetical protein
MKSKLFLALLFLSMLSCSPDSLNPEPALNGLLGKWDATGTAVTEAWTSGEKGVYRAVVTSHAGPSPEIQELIEVKKDGDDWYFTGTVMHQNSGLPIRFKLVDCKDDRLKFENAEHDFPQNIEYFIINKNKVKARVSGSQNGEFKEFIIAYYRSNY